MQLFDAVLLSLLLRSSRSRQILSTVAPAPESLDQRRSCNPDVLSGRVSERARILGGPLAKATKDAERLVKRTLDAKIDTVVYGEPDYPTLLAEIVDPPPVLWIYGERARLQTSGIALVGSRTGTRYACTVAERLGSDLSERGVTIVSGLARGVDGAAHRGGLQGPGGTVAVLGCGVDVDYPPEHAELAKQIASHGVVVSELGPSSPPRRAHFPRRNRIISGLSLAVVVVEANARSGSLITARVAAEQGREVMAVPGSVLTERNRGGHGLLKDGAKIVETADDILEECRDLVAGSRPSEVSVHGDLADDVLGLMELGESYDLDTLVRKSRLDGPRILERLVDLELAGRLERSRTGYYTRL